MMTAPGEFGDIFRAELAQLGFDVFLDIDDQTFETSIEQSQFVAEDFDQLLAQYAPLVKPQYEFRTEAKQNWNQLWEANYAPVEIAGRVRIRAEFHPPVGFEHELLITPKMSFGTGHHATTALMVQHQLACPHQGRRVADFGCGTGILAILAMKLGAARADACDIEDWCVENALENAALNQVVVNVRLGTASLFAAHHQGYDLIFANINLHVLLAELPLYAQLLAPGGQLFMSGFYEADLPQLTRAAAQLGLQRQHYLVQQRWTAAEFSAVG
ncbi:MAG: 50S ribosomal protein L11 methyltransferase [Bernardetiaceae bacterium]|jgi:ribosomal protein L11 methyltransferase|nr:50S ribosomal protein L11 methyltransferase [Bernardetiaceae bacterium]